METPERPGESSRQREAPVRDIAEDMLRSLGTVDMSDTALSNEARPLASA